MIWNYLISLVIEGIVLFFLSIKGLGFRNLYGYVYE